ncbi:MAG: hypothetical protein HY775_00260 [Acidobacteria bacterium]|nr:hypothetical protein [Acidobacteriota bacterium]
MRSRTIGIVGLALVGVALVLASVGSTLTGARRLGPTGVQGWGFQGGMMGQGGGMMGQGARGRGPARVSPPQAKAAVERYLGRYGSPDLELGELLEFDSNFYAVVEEKSTGRGAFEVLVDRWTGAVFPEPGPNMMWNAKYGMMGDGSGGSTAVSAKEAREIARRWLEVNRPGETPSDHVHAFHGYDTLMTERDGRTAGMLSVNAATGAVWYHTWHGAFVREV